MAGEIKNIPYPQFIHLRVHTSYSLSEGAIRPEDVGEVCLQNNMPAVAVTDSGNLFGLLEVAMYCRKKGVQSIPGIEANFTLSTENSAPGDYPKIILLAQNEAGYRNLLKLSSDSFLKGHDHSRPLISLDELKKHSDGIICLTGGHNGVLDTLIRANQISGAQKLIEELKATFPQRLYIELNRVGQEKQATTETALLDLARKSNLPLVATNNVLFSTAEMHEAQDILMCIAEGVFQSDENRKKFSGEHYFKSQEQMVELFADMPEALENTVNIALRCSYMSQESKPMLPKFPTLGNRGEDEEIWDVTFKGLCKRLGIKEDDNRIKEAMKPYFDRMEYEIGVIIKMGFQGYFLIVSDFIRWAKSQNIPVGPGRGSGAGSVVAWAMEITNLDPLRFGLLFERFLNPERISMPDFDIDFCQERRGEVIEYVQKKYGRDKVAQIITFGKLQARAVLRDVGRVMQIPYFKVDRICKMIPFNPIDPITLDKAIAMDPELQRERKSDETIAQLLDIGLKLEGMHRHASTHAAGVVIGSHTLQEIVPLYSDNRSEIPTTQYSMKYCEAAGLVKFDFLGLKTLTLIQKTTEMVEANEGVKINIDIIPYEDDLTFKMLAEGKGIGVFQMESAGMRDSMRKMRLDSIEDIIALISLYRPGPMENIPNYISTKLGKKRPDYLHPSLKSVLEETHGVIIYQEQVMEIAKILAGYTLGGADLLRRAMGKKIKSEMDAQREMFVSGAVRNKIDKQKAEDIFDLVAKFAGYGFNKSHAAAYAVIGYHTAYLKAHYPAEFLCACMNQEFTNTDKLLMFREEARKMSITVLPPDINKSDSNFKVEKLGNGIKAVRYAVGALKNVGAAAMIDLQNEREANGPYKNLDDFIARVPPSVMNKRQIESLSGSGAFDSIHKNRHQLFEEAQLITKFNQSIFEEKNSSQESLFGDDSAVSHPKIKLKDIEEWNQNEMTLKEFESIGFYLDNHPASNIMKILPTDRFIPIEELEDRIPITIRDENSNNRRDRDHGGIKTYLIGVPNRVVQRAAGGRRFAYFSLSDPTGMVEVNMFDDDLINKSRDLLESNQLIVVLVEARKDEGGLRFIAEDVIELKAYLKTLKGKAEITISEKKFGQSTLNDLKALLANDNGKLAAADIIFPVNINIVTASNFNVRIVLPDDYKVTSEQIIDKKIPDNMDLKILFG